MNNFTATTEGKIFGTNDYQFFGMEAAYFLTYGPQNDEFAETLRQAFSASNMRYHITYASKGKYFLVEPHNVEAAHKLVERTPYC